MSFDDTVKSKAHKEEATNNDIETIHLYLGVQERIDKELQQHLQTTPQNHNDGLFDMETLSKYDSMHYGGNAAIQECIKYVSNDSTDRTLILDVGAGLGGPARYLACRLANCTVIAMELQESLWKKGQELTSSCRELQNDSTTSRVEHVHGNILNYHADHKLESTLPPLDAICSWLSFLHIPNKPKLLSTCYGLLKNNTGVLYCEDFYKTQPMTHSEVQMLQDQVHCTDLPTKQEYLAQLRKSKFVNITWIDMTTEWTRYTRKRLELFQQDKERFKKLHGPVTYGGLHQFYATMVQLFQGDNLGGVRYIAQKKST